MTTDRRARMVAKEFWRKWREDLFGERILEKMAGRRYDRWRSTGTYSYAAKMAGTSNIAHRPCLGPPPQNSYSHYYLTMSDTGTSSKALADATAASAVVVPSSSSSSSSLGEGRLHDSADESAGGGGGGIGSSAASSEPSPSHAIDNDDDNDNGSPSLTNHASLLPPPKPHHYQLHHRSLSFTSLSITTNNNDDESRFRKIITRILSSLIMISLFIAILLSGHVYVCTLVFILEILLFRELVTVRYNAYFHRIDSTIPLFRTTQWMWFFVSIFYTYSEFAVEMIKNNTTLHEWLEYAQLAPMLSFTLYAGTFVLTISTMQAGHIRFQVNQLCWTIVVLCLTVGQLKYIMHNVYNGLIWFTLPILLVITNDIMAYVSGITCGRKFIQRPFMQLSPNKTWEGFIGGGIFTVVTGWYLSRYLARWSWMTCPTNQFVLFPTKLECELENIFHEATMYFPSQAFELLPRAMIRLFWPHVVEICSVVEDSGVGSNDVLVSWGPCISGAVNQKHVRWEMALSIVPVQLHAISLSLFASLVAPFGGFLASGIKRAYGIKDFDSIIPGHGGLMDRFDCQLIMALATWVHYNTFVKITTVSVAKLLYMYKLLGEEERGEFMEKIAQLQLLSDEA